MKIYEVSTIVRKLRGAEITQALSSDSFDFDTLEELLNSEMFKGQFVKLEKDEYFDYDKIKDHIKKTKTTLYERIIVCLEEDDDCYNYVEDYVDINFVRFVSKIVPKKATKIVL